MKVIRIRHLATALAALALLLAAAPVLAAAPAAAPAATPAPSAACGPTLPDLAIGDAGLPGSPLLEPLPQALAPHCCSSEAADACRASCKEIAPGCKGQIGCRAGECVCTCSCP